MVFSLDGTDELDQELARRLIAESESTPGIQRSNNGGWHSVPDLSRRDEPCYRAVMNMVVDHVRAAFVEVAQAAGENPALPFRYAVQSWAMVMGNNDYTILHDHAESHWSVVYYADAGDSDMDAHPSSGLLAFVDPRGGLPATPGVDLFPSTFTVRPRTSSLVVFPGWLQHYVHPYRGERPRVSISCNLRMDIVMPPGAGTH